MEKIGLFDFYKNKKVLVTGGFGFKGTFLSYILRLLGSKVSIYSLHSENSFLYKHLVTNGVVFDNFEGDILDVSTMTSIIKKIQPDIVFHLAAQPLVSTSYENPLRTYQTNVIGTLNVLNVCKGIQSVKSIINVTTDKVYENYNFENNYSFKETDVLNGLDPYSNSKSLADLLSQSFFKSFSPEFSLFNVRSGNVIGGGDRSPNRISNDLLSYFLGDKSKPFILRAPNATRPYMHVIDTLRGYLSILPTFKGKKTFETFNFGPINNESITNKDFVNHYAKSWNSKILIDSGLNPIKESTFLSLNSLKANSVLSWQPNYSILQAIQKTVDFEKAILVNDSINFMNEVILENFGGIL
jgi:CDP-glucose 4,6-dehydratase